MMQSSDPLKHVKLLRCSSCIPKQAVFDAAADAVIETMTRKVQEGIKLSVLLSTKKSLKSRFLDMFRKAPKVADDAAEAAARQLDDQVTNGLRIVGLVDPNEIMTGAASEMAEKVSPTRYRPSAAMVTWKTTRWSGSIATSAFARSTKAPTTSSAW